MTNNVHNEETQKIKELFDRLDKNQDGRIDFEELKDYINDFNKQASGPSHSSSNEQKAMKVFKLMSTTKSKNGKNKIQFDFRDFVEYVNNTDKKIELLFKDLDGDKNGIIDKLEIKMGFENLGIILSDAQIEKLLLHLDKNNSLQIDWKEWRDFFRFAPHDKMEEALRHWRIDTFTDYSDTAIPKDFTQNEKQSGLWWRNLVAGGCAGAISRTCTAPLDRVRIYLQVHAADTKTNILGVGRNMIKEGGVRSLWRGNFINVLKITPESALKFTAYEQIKALMGVEGQQLPPMQRFLSGTMAGFIAQSTIYPMEVLKTRLALRKTGEFNGISDCVRKVYRKEGIKTFYRGYLMNTLGIGGVGIDLTIYESLKNMYKEKYPDNPQPTTVALLVIANTSSTTAMLCTYPLFLVRTRMQSSSNSKETISGIVDKIYRSTGLLGFYKGAFANMAKVAPAASIGYLSYEYFSKLLKIK